MPTTSDPQNSNRDVAARPIVNGHVSSSGGLPPRRGSAGKTIGTILVFVVLFILAWGLGVLMHALKGKPGEAGGSKSIGQTIGDIGQIVGNPRGGFLGKDKIVICCMGIDDNWTNSDEVYTAGARTDTLFLMTLDFNSKKLTMLSIPRDTYVPIAGANYSDKINSAYASGGPMRTEATIQQWLHVTPDYYVVLNIDATKRMVDALGGVDVNVEHQMDYDDQWGHLHVHLKPGFQHLDGEQAVGFARYRHGNHGVTPEDGDERRMYRQHVLLRAMIAKAKTFSSVLQANNLIDTGMSCIRTDMTRTQLFDLAAMFHSVDQENDVTTASLQGQDGRGPHGAYVMLVDDRQANLYADWLVRGDDSAGRALTSVRVANVTLTPGLAAKASDALRAIGFNDTNITTSTKTTNPSRTIIIDGGVANHHAASDIANTLGLTNAVIVHETAKPNHLGWTAPPSVDVELGNDYALIAKQSPVPPAQ